MKLISDYNRFELYSYKVEDLIKYYKQSKQLKEEIRPKYFSVYEELINEELIEVNWMQVSENHKKTGK